MPRSEVAGLDGGRWASSGGQPSCATTGCGADGAPAQQGGPELSYRRVPELAVFTRTYARASFEQVLAAALRDGYRAVHLNFSALGMPTIPQDLDAAVCSGVATLAEGIGMRIVGVSATYNMIDPNRQRRRAQTAAARRLIELAPLLGTDLVTLCSGTCDGADMWRAHSDNETVHAWREMTETLEQLLLSARSAGVKLGIEPERANIVSTPHLARQLLLRHGPEHLGVVLDLSNLVDFEDDNRRLQQAREAICLLSPWLSVVHANDAGADRKQKAPGCGRIDWPAVFSMLHDTGYSGPVVVHGVSEAESASTHEYLTELLQRQFAVSSPSHLRVDE